MQTNYSPSVQQVEKTEKAANFKKQPGTKIEFNAATATIPLRLFLSISFIVAAFDKITDPEFFDPKAFGYIGNQLSAFAGQSPIGGFLLNVAVPNATLFGWSVLLGELAIGLGTLFGLFSRTAAFFGFVLSLTLWLSTSWTVAPFFLGPDLPYAIGWLTLCIAGAPAIFSLDWQLKNFLQQRQQQQQTGLTAEADEVLSVSEPNPAAIARRNFILAGGGTLLAGAVTGVAVFNSLVSKTPATTTSSQPVATSTPTAAKTAAPTSPATQAPQNTTAATSTTAAASQTQPTQSSNPTTAAPSQTQANPTTAASTSPASTTSAPAPAGAILATLASLPAGKAKAFTTPDSKEAAILVHNDDGTVCAFSSVCTHQGCAVDYNAAARALACPCHGAQFDSKTGEATKRPATRALKSFKVQVDNSGNILYIQS